MSHKIFQMPFATVYPLYVKKVLRKGQTEADLRKVIRWLTGFTDAQLQKQIDSGATFATCLNKPPQVLQDQAWSFQASRLWL